MLQPSLTPLSSHVLTSQLDLSRNQLCGLDPRGRGTFTRTLHRYVREQNVLSWLDAIEKMTLLPARRLEHMAPSFARKGRIQLGMDADIVAFDPNRVQDQASYEDPNQPSMGMQYVLVNGTPIVQRGKLVDGVYPGLRITLTGHR